MATFMPVLPRSGYIAAQDMSGDNFIYRCMKITGANVVDRAGAGDDIVGVLINKPRNGKSVTIQEDGVAKVSAAGAIAAGVSVKPAANGQITTAVSGDRRIGVTRTAVGGAGQLVEVDLRIGSVTP